MDQTIVTGFVVLIVTAVFQVLKDRVGWAKTALPWIAAVLGALATGAQASLANGGIDSGTLGVAATGGAATLGLHKLLFQSTRVGAILKGIGGSTFKEPPPV